MPADQPLQRQFESAVDEHSGAMYRVAWRLTGNRELAAELVQESYLQAWQGLGSLRDRSRIKSWLFGILRFQYSKLVRRESRMATVSGSAVEHLVEPAPASDPELIDRVQSAIAQLRDEHKFPILLVSMEGLSVEEAAAILELPRGTVLSRLHRGRQKLKQLLQPEASPGSANGGNHHGPLTRP